MFLIIDIAHCDEILNYREEAVVQHEDFSNFCLEVYLKLKIREKMNEFARF